MTFRPLLSPPQFRVLLLLANGKNRRQIAALHHNAHITVANHAYAMRKELGAETDAHAVAIAFCTGLLISDDIDGFDSTQDTS